MVVKICTRENQGMSHSMLLFLFILLLELFFLTSLTVSALLWLHFCVIIYALENLYYSDVAAESVMFSGF